MAWRSVNTYMCVGGEFVTSNGNTESVQDNGNESVTALIKLHLKTLTQSSWWPLNKNLEKRHITRKVSH